MNYAINCPPFESIHLLADDAKQAVIIQFLITQKNINNVIQRITIPDKPMIVVMDFLTTIHCGLVMSCGDIDLGQHWPK